jgi:hypothetical protein
MRLSVDDRTKELLFSCFVLPDESLDKLKLHYHRASEIEALDRLAALSSTGEADGQCVSTALLAADKFIDGGRGPHDRRL